MTQTIHPINAIVPFIPEEDILSHIEDTPLFWVARNGQPVKITWNELSDTERELLQKAQERAAYCATFAIY